MDETKELLIKCFSAVFPQLRTGDIPQATPESVKGWDSVATVTLLAMLEQEFSIEVDFTAVEEFGSFPSILAYIQRQKGASAVSREFAKPLRVPGNSE